MGRSAASSMMVNVAGIVIETNSVTTAIDLALEAARRGVVVKPRATVKKAPSPPPRSATSSVTTLTAWDRFVAHVRRPERRNQLTLLRHLKANTSKGRYVRREELLVVMGFDGANGNLSLGGVCKGIVKKSKSCGLDAEDVIQWSTLGYRAGRLVISNELPEVTP